MAESLLVDRNFVSDICKLKLLKNFFKPLKTLKTKQAVREAATIRRTPPLWPWPVAFWPWKWCSNHMWRGLRPLCQF